MTQLKDLMKREVIALDVGRRIGKPADILVDPESHTVAAIVLSYGSLPETSVVFPASAVNSFDTDSLAIDTLRSLHLALYEDQLLNTLERAIRLRHRTVFWHQGQRMGTIVAIEVDPEGKVTEYRLRHARFGLLRPTFALSPDDVERLGPDVVVAKPEPPAAAPGAGGQATP